MLVDNREGPIVDAMATTADGTAEAALRMAYRLQQGRKGKVTLAADRAYDRRDLVEALRAMGVAVHAAERRQGSALDRRTTRHASYEQSQRGRPAVERAFGWLMGVPGLERVKLRGLAKVNWLLQFAAAAYNLWRLPEVGGSGGVSHREDAHRAA